MKLRILSWNIHKCVGIDGICDPERILDTIAAISPDIAVLQEADRKFGRKKLLLNPESILHKTGLRLPSFDLTNRGAGYMGNALLVKPRISVNGYTPVKLPSFEPRGAVLWQLQSGNTPFFVVGAHLGLVGTYRTRQAAAIAALISSKPSVPTIVAADTNDWRDRSGSMRPIEEMLGAGCKLATFPARFPVLPLDRIFAGRGAEVMNRMVLDCQGASDHAPLLAEVRIDGVC